MTAKKNDTETPKKEFPETFGQLVEEYPELKGLPELVGPRAVTATSCSQRSLP